MIGKDDNTSRAVTSKRCAGWRKLKQLSDICGNMFCGNLFRLKQRLYKACKRRLMCYAMCELNAMLKVDTRQKQTTKMKMI